MKKFLETFSSGGGGGGGGGGGKGPPGGGKGGPPAGRKGLISEVPKGAKGNAARQRTIAAGKGVARNSPVGNAAAKAKAAIKRQQNAMVKKLSNRNIVVK